MKRNGIRSSSTVVALAVLAVACGAGPEPGSDPDSPRRVIVRSSTDDVRSVSLDDGTPMASDPEVVVLSDGEASPASRAPSATTEPARAKRSRPASPRVIEEVVYVVEEPREEAPRPTTGAPSRPAATTEPVPQSRPSAPRTPPVEREPTVATAPTTPAPAPRPAPTPERSSRVEDAAVGAAIGAGVGAVLGGERGAVRGAIGGAVGGAVGGRTGAVLGGVLGGARGGRPAPRRGGGCFAETGGFDLVVR